MEDVVIDMLKVAFYTGLCSIGCYHWGKTVGWKQGFNLGLHHNPQPPKPFSKNRWL